MTQRILNQSNVFDDADLRVEVIMPAGDANVPGGIIFWGEGSEQFLLSMRRRGWLFQD
jgi:hypothetical protein